MPNSKTQMHDSHRLALEREGNPGARASLTASATFGPGRLTLMTISGGRSASRPCARFPGAQMVPGTLSPQRPLPWAMAKQATWPYYSNRKHLAKKPVLAGSLACQFTCTDRCTLLCFHCNICKTVVLGYVPKGNRCLPHLALNIKLNPRGPCSYIVYP